MIKKTIWVTGSGGRLGPAIIKELGKGTYGWIYLVKCNKDNKLYGYNTDFYGLLSLIEEIDVNPYFYDLYPMNLPRSKILSCFFYFTLCQLPSKFLVQEKDLFRLSSEEERAVSLSFESLIPQSVEPIQPEIKQEEEEIGEEDDNEIKYIETKGNDELDDIELCQDDEDTRNYFEKTDDTITDPESNIYFFHCGTTGMDWAIRKKGYYDIMIGSFGTLGEDDVKEALSDFYEMYPDMTNKLIRGGSFGKIPLGKTLPVFVFNGYAAVGDSAVMTDPLSGSGLDMSIKAGKMLADTVIASGGEATRENLWKYNYSFFKEEAEKYYGDAMIKSFLSAVSADDIDFFFEKKIMTEKEVSNGGKTKYSAMELLQKASVLKRPGLLLPLAGVLLKLKASSDSKKLIPEEYNEGGIEKFKEIYSRF